MSDEVDDVVAYVRDEMNPHIESYTRSYLRRRIDSRLRKTGCESYTDYLELLEDSEDERAELSNAFWINVTEFFRNPEVWESLYELVPHDGLRALSAGCADGREPYSLAVLAREKGVDARIEAIDADPDAVAVSREGRYDDVDTDRIRGMSFVGDVSRHVRETDRGYEVTDATRRSLSFHQGDIMETMGALRFDLVLCRNLLIYINTESKEPLLRSIAEMVDDGGYLVLGKTERLPDSFSDEFEAVDRRLRIYRKG